MRKQPTQAAMQPDIYTASKSKRSKRSGVDSFEELSLWEGEKKELCLSNLIVGGGGGGDVDCYHCWRCEKGEDRRVLGRMVGSEKGAAVVVAVAREYARLVDPSIRKYSDLKGLDGIELCGKQVPKVSLVGYISHLIEMLNDVYEQSSDFGNTGFRCLMIGTIYIDRLLKFHKDFKLHAFNIHRVFFAAMMLATKFSEDRSLGLRSYAQMGGVDVAQAMAIESSFCNLMNFRFGVDPKVELQEKFDQFCRPLKIRLEEPTWSRL